MIKIRMNPTDKALWFIESHFAEEITLDDIADVAGVSKYHISRAFGWATGQSLMQYVRGRRLTVAARSLANGATGILPVALEAGYGSHEAFTRAFREQFGQTPETTRAQGNLLHLNLTEPIKMGETLLTKLEPPRVEDLKTLLVAGLGERYTSETSAGIPAQWQRFAPHIGHIPGQVGQTAYGVICNGDDAGNVEYVCGVEVTDFSRIPKDWSQVRIPAHRYVVFTHREHISAIRRTWNTIWNKWFPESKHVHAEGPEFERYDSRFDPRTGEGEVELWIPVKSYNGN